LNLIVDNCSRDAYSTSMFPPQVLRPCSRFMPVRRRDQRLDADGMSLNCQFVVELS
jgi:hypothetical protein